MGRIIDVHIHCSEMDDDILNSYAKINGLEYNMKELIDLMKENDIESGLLLSPTLANGIPVPNERIIELCKRSNGRLFPVLTVEPSKTSVSESLQMVEKNKGMIKGFKIRLGYRSVYPYDPVFYPLYEYAQMTSLPVMYHTGDTAVPNASLLHAHPINIDRVANQWDELKMIICHFGNPWFMDTAEIVYKHQNVYADISGLFLRGAKYSSKYMGYLAEMISNAIYHIGNVDKILFGTDYPVETYSDAIAFVRMLDIDEEDREKIFYYNAKKLFF
ncbi:MAG: amidohydrolase family protein [Conexivisphaerales archaeon]